MTKRKTFLFSAKNGPLKIFEGRGDRAVFLGLKISDTLDGSLAVYADSPVF